MAAETSWCVCVWVAADDDVVAGCRVGVGQAEKEGCLLLLLLLLLLYMPEQHGRPGQLLSIEHELPCSAIVRRALEFRGRTSYLPLACTARCQQATCGLSLTLAVSLSLTLSLSIRVGIFHYISYSSSFSEFFNISGVLEFSKFWSVGAVCRDASACTDRCAITEIQKNKKEYSTERGKS